MSNIDPFRYGVLHQKVDDYQRKLDDMERKINKMEANLERLIAMAERSKGSLWALMGFASVAGAFISYLSDFFFKK